MRFRFYPFLLLLGLGFCSTAIWAEGQSISDRLSNSIKMLSSVGSRVTGYPGANESADWIQSQLYSFGIDQVYSHEYSQIVPIDEGFRLDVADEEFKIYGIWPNLIRTSTLPSEGISGRLIYGGRGELLDGQSIEGNIVLLEYDCQDKWLDVFQMGARAVVFLQVSNAHRSESEQKFLDVPANLPRFFAPKSFTSQLREFALRNAQAKIMGSMPIESVKARNLIALIEGHEPDLNKEAIVVSAYYDAISPVPALAPGAEQASSAAALLEMAREWSLRPPARTLCLVWTAGHFEHMSGMRHLTPVFSVAAGRRDNDALTSKERVLADHLSKFRFRFFAGIDLSSGSPFMSVMRPRVPYRTPLLAPPITNRLFALAQVYEDSVLGGVPALANGLKQDYTRQGLGSIAEIIPLDASVIALSGAPTIGFTTVNDSRSRFDTVDDRINGMNIDWLGDQVDLLKYVITGLSNDPKLEEWSWGNDAFGQLSGQVVHYGPRSYLPDKPTSRAIVRVRLRNPTLAGVRPDIWAAADDSGFFNIPGIESKIIYTKPVRVEGYALAFDGSITDAPDWGINGERKLPGRALKVLMDDLDEEVQIVTAPLIGTTLLGVFDPRNLITPENINVIDADLDAEPTVFGTVLPLTSPEIELFSYQNYVGSNTETAAVIFMPTEKRFKVVMSTGRYGLGRRLLLLNTSDGSPHGRGFEVEREGLLSKTTYRVAHDMIRLNDSRISNLERHGVRNGRLSEFHNRAKAELFIAEESLDSKLYRDFLGAARRAWSYSVAAYRDVESTQSGVVNGALFLLALFIPFAHFLERLIFCFSDLRNQVLGYFFLFFLGFAALSRIHPAFELSISPFVILLGFVILALGLLVTGIGISRLNRELQEIARGRRGPTSMQRGGAVGASISVGLAHLRRRPLRTGMTCATLILLTFSVLSFTSIRSTLRTNWIDVGAQASYEGALVRMLGWKAMGLESYRMFTDWYGEENVAPRAWKSVSSAASTFRIERSDNPLIAVGYMGLVGLTEAESRLVKPQDYLIAGRWLMKDEANVCLLPTALADSLGVSVEDFSRNHVRIFGEVFRVIGILSSEALANLDLNGEPLTPLDPEAQQPAEVKTSGVGAPQHYAHLPGNATVVLPFSNLMRWQGAKMVSLGINLAGESVRKDLEELSELLDLNLFAGISGRRYLINTVGVSSVSGLGELIIPLAIAALIVLNTMLGAVYERTKEIGTLNAIGLAPIHVSALFIAEAVALAVVGAILGYLLGQTTAQFISSLGWLQGLQLNYSSLAAIVTVGLVILLVVASALYPAHMAGKICTPGIERRWRPPSADGHSLRMRLPFTLARREAEGMAAFQAEFWSAHREQSIGAGFYVEQLRVIREAREISLGAKVWLAPFDQGVVQETKLSICPGTDPRYCDIDVNLNLIAGDWDTWQRVARTFLDDLRKQFLVWRTLSEDDRSHYADILVQWEMDIEPEVKG
ncbi:MAG: FtsX-like permease family protein [Candidatus Latescibacterota bacterium]|nr:FtsX-like permease family protein [Candidatus Latescibacterota bacterium]